MPHSTKMFKTFWEEYNSMILSKIITKVKKSIRSVYRIGEIEIELSNIVPSWFNYLIDDKGWKEYIPLKAKGGYKYLFTRDPSVVENTFDGIELSNIINTGEGKVVSSITWGKIKPFKMVYEESEGKLLISFDHCPLNRPNWTKIRTPSKNKIALDLIRRSGVYPKKWGIRKYYKRKIIDGKEHFIRKKKYSEYTE